MKKSILLRLIFCSIGLSFFAIWFFLDLPPDGVLFFAMIVGIIGAFLIEKTYQDFKILKTMIEKTPKSQRPKILCLYVLALFLSLGFFIALIFIDLYFGRVVSFAMIIGCACMMFFTAIYLSIKLMAGAKDSITGRLKGLLIFLYIAPIIAVIVYLNKVGGICSIGIPVADILSLNICGT